MKCGRCKGRKCAGGCGKVVCFHTAKVRGKDTRKGMGELDPREWHCHKCNRELNQANGWKN